MSMLLLSLPVSGRVSSPYGWRVHPVSGGKRFHNGVDYAVSSGTEIRAAAAGRVTFAAASGDSGNLVKIDHGGGVETLYAHNSRLLVRAGQGVEKGGVIALSGATGRVTGAHLHFGVKINGAYYDPQEILSLGVNTTQGTTQGTINSLTLKQSLAQTAVLGGLMVFFLLVSRR